MSNPLSVHDFETREFLDRMFPDPDDDDGFEIHFKEETVIENGEEVNIIEMEMPNKYPPGFWSGYPGFRRPYMAQTAERTKRRIEEWLAERDKARGEPASAKPDATNLLHDPSSGTSACETSAAAQPNATNSHPAPRASTSAVPDESENKNKP